MNVILGNCGITIKVSEAPGFEEYAVLRNKLAKMHPLRRWLSFRLRRELRGRMILTQHMLMAAVFDEWEAWKRASK